MSLKGKPNYKPDEAECQMFLKDAYKSGGTNLKGLMILLKLEYPALTDNEVKRQMKKWLDDNKISVKGE